MKHFIELYDKLNLVVLDKFELDQKDQAYQMAIQYEAMGLDVEIRQLSTVMMLAQELGANEEQCQTLYTSMEEEISNHDDSCCHTKK